MLGPIVALAGAGIAYLLMSRKTPEAPPPVFTTMPTGPAPAVTPTPAAPSNSWQLAAGQSYNITQAVHDVPGAEEMQRVVGSLQQRGHSNVITSQNSTVPTEWLVNYDSFQMPQNTAIAKGQTSKVGPYTTTVLDVRSAGDLGYFNVAEDA